VGRSGGVACSSEVRIAADCAGAAGITLYRPSLSLRMLRLQFLTGKPARFSLKSSCLCRRLCCSCLQFSWLRSLYNSTLHPCSAAIPVDAGIAARCSRAAAALSLHCSHLPHPPGPPSKGNLEHPMHSIHLKSKPIHCFSASFFGPPLFSLCWLLVVRWPSALCID
jgi:hypothetical protein